MTAGLALTLILAGAAMIAISAVLTAIFYIRAFSRLHKAGDGLAKVAENRVLAIRHTFSKDQPRPARWATLIIGVGGLAIMLVAAFSAPS